MNTTISRIAAAAVLAVLTLSTTACGEDEVSPRQQQLELPETGPEAVEVESPAQPDDCPSYLHGWERAHCV